jgi:hypothetical protein
MKVIKAKIKVDQSQGSTQYEYPSIWLANKERIPMIVYPNDRSDQVSDEKGEYQIVYPVVPDDLYEEMLKLHPEQFEPAGQAEFEQYADKHHPRKVVTLDQNKVNEIVSKIALGKPVTKDEKNSINPEVDGGAVVKSKRVVDEVIEMGVVFEK